MIGIICAMDVELEKILAMMSEDVTETVSRITFHKGKIGAREVVCAVCGVGKVFAGMCAQTMILKYAPECIINVGVAGSLDTRLKIADIVVAEDLVQHDMDITPLGIPRGMILGTDYVSFPTEPAASEKLMAAIAAVNEERTRTGQTPVGTLRGRIASGDQFIATKEQKDAIVSVFGGMCCEMEGAAIAQTCYLDHVPFVVIRAISDKPDGGGAVDFETFQAAAAENCARAVRYMVEH